MSVRFELVREMPPAELERAWRELEARAAPHVFLSWDWIGCWIAEAGLRPAVLLGRADGRIVLLGALVPSARRDILPLTIGGLQLQTTGDEQQDIVTIEYNGFLIDPDWRGRLEQAALTFLLGGVVVDGRRRDELHLRNVPAELESSVAATGFHYDIVNRKPSWRIDLAAVRAQGKPYLPTLSANTRQQIRRSMRLYQQRGELKAEWASSVAQALGFLDAMAELHQRYWIGRGYAGGFATPFFARFQRRLIETCLPRGTVEIVRITAGSDVLGYVYNLVYRGHVYAYQSGIHYEDDPRLKPGLIGHVLCIEQHLANGDQVYDFMAGEARYKANLGQAGPDMMYMLVGRPTLSLRLENALRATKRWVSRLIRR